ncbi:MAG: pyridoxamine 5'-phosphate oxidase family protein [Dehalococcoidia bacterium]|nr:pyridoxamine 5'-phosphate oxidase family protein [Dehalococcoidia bacterium]
MEGSGDLRQAVKDILSTQRFCVLATQGQGQPYGSLVAFAETGDLRQLVFATKRGTRKFSNLMADPRVALVVDSRSNSDADLGSAVAITALGPAHEAAGDERERLAGVYLAKHPGLAEFVGSPETAVCAVAVVDYVIARFREVTVLRP